MSRLSCHSIHDYIAIFGRPFVKRLALFCQTIVCLSVLSVCLSVCNVGALWPKGWTDQDETWHAGRPRPWPHCVGWGPRSPPQKGGGAPNFRPVSMRPDGCIDQDTSWYGDRPRPRRHCVRWGPSCLLPPPRKSGGAEAPFPIFGPCLLWPNCCMDQNDTWHGGGPWSRRHCTIWGPSSPSPKREQPPNYRPIFIVAKRLDASRCHLVWR